MLRKKLLARLGLLVIGFIAGAVVSITLLQGILRDLDAMNAEAAGLIDGAQEITDRAAAIQAELQAVHAGATPRAGLLDREASAIRLAVQGLSQQPLLQHPGTEAAASFDRLRGLLPPLPGTTGSAPTDAPTDDQLTAAGQLQRESATLARLARQDVASRQASLSRRLRVLLEGLTIAALVMVNIAVAVLLWTVNTILRPVGELVDGSRELARENFGCRVRIDQDDEFGELAHAFNNLAGQLQTNEERKVQALRQLAVTLNHELNNVLATIGLQLQLLDRRAGATGRSAGTGPDPALSAQLHDIHQNLGRVAQTIASLRNVRRIVLTDYMPGEKMLDLPRSVAADDDQLLPPAGTPTTVVPAGVSPITPVSTASTPESRR